MGETDGDGLRFHEQFTTPGDVAGFPDGYAVGPETVEDVPAFFADPPETDTTVHIGPCSMRPDSSSPPRTGCYGPAGCSGIRLTGQKWWMSDPDFLLLTGHVFREVRANDGWVVADPRLWSRVPVRGDGAHLFWLRGRRPSGGC